MTFLHDDQICNLFTQSSWDQTQSVGYDALKRSVSLTANAYFGADHCPLDQFENPQGDWTIDGQSVTLAVAAGKYRNRLASVTMPLGFYNERLSAELQGLELVTPLPSGKVNFTSTNFNGGATDYVVDSGAVFQPAISTYGWNRDVSSQRFYAPKSLKGEDQIDDYGISMKAGDAWQWVMNSDHPVKLHIAAGRENYPQTVTHTLCYGYTAPTATTPPTVYKTLTFEATPENPKTEWIWA